MSAYYPQDANFLSRRAIVFVIIVAIHALAIWAFASGFAQGGKRYLETILQTSVIQTEKPKDLPPPPPPVDLKERPPVQVVAPDITINVPVDLPPPPITNVTTHATPAPPAPRPPPPPTKLEVTYRPDPQNYYPEQARRDGQEGRAQVKICINTSGKVESAEVTASSGFPLLDEAAIKVGKAMRFKPPTQEGRPVSTCPILPVKFELHAGTG
ncbi:MAG TPA: energy transducer TonB [Steroidobacteraceae bacterium]